MTIASRSGALGTEPELLRELAANARLPFHLQLEHRLTVRLHDLPAWEAASRLRHGLPFEGHNG
jgi:hypothetical protein